MAVPVAIAAPKRTSSAYMIFMLGAVSTFCGLVIVLAYLGTKEAIRKNLATITRESVFAALPEAKRQDIYQVDPSGEITKVEGLEGDLPKMFACYDDAGKLVGVVCETAGRGYADVIKALYAYSPEKNAIVGFRVLDAKETPGLGDRISYDPDFLANFKELDATIGADGKLVNPIVAVKHGTKSQSWQIDSISGATISSKAVGRMVNAGAEKMIPIIQKQLEALRKGN